ncbi:MAG: hypothetical protein IKK87_09170 [Bacteroidaceae bacterium]|nr:hypothetical protein [Bacteroidaceae bacterium]
MKKNLRLLCLGLAAATFTAGFAQAENVTSKLRNADMEQGIKGWGVDGEANIFGKNKKNGGGYHGMKDGVLENWNGNGNALKDNSISQTVRELPSGTYVFGAYIGASLQGTDESNKDAVEGVTLFANEAGVPVATDNPDKGRQEKWGHAGKFNVAAKVTEGSLNVGIDIKATTANYVVWDNATLYYFGNMSEAEALNEMAKIDIAATRAIADTFIVNNHKMNADTLALLNEGITAANALATADQLWQTNEDLYWAINKATKSVSDYRSFNNAIVAAEKAAAGEWSSAIANELAALNEALAAAKKTYADAAAGRPELDVQKAALREATALVTLDTCYDVLDGLDEYVNSLDPSDELGEYSDTKINQLIDLLGTARAAVDAAYAGDETALRTRHIYDSLFVAIQYILDNPNSVDAFPFTIGEADGTIANRVDGRFEFTSKTYTFAFPVTNIRFTFMDNHNTNGAAGDNSGFPSVAIAEFYVYDGEGNPIDLSEENFRTNAQETSEGPMVNICDGDLGTFWHSTWSAKVTEHHYLEVQLPDGLDLTSLSFGWKTRYDKQVIPKTVVISSVSEASSMLESAVQTAKQMNAFAGTDPGFYNADLSAFWNAIAAAEAVLENGGTDEEMYAAIGELETQQGLVDEMQVNLPAADKKYHLVIGYDGFYAKQGVQKALYARGDSLVWWQTADVTSIGQEFVLESIGKMEDETPIYKVLNVHTNRYLVLDTEANHVALTADKAEADTVKLVSLGAGAFNLQATDGSAIHAGDHNSGAPSSAAGAYGGIYGTESGLCFYPGAFNSASAWFVREMHALPYTAAVAGADYRSETFHLYSGVNTLNLTADKACAFTDLTVYDLWGNVIAADVNVSGNSATLMLDTLGIESFSLTFKNNEGVTSLVVNGNISKLSELQTAYDATVALAPEVGNEVMQYSEAGLKDYNAAIKAAEALLASGGTDEQIAAAIAALEKAVAELTPNMPDPDKTYFIVSALDAFEETHGVRMMLYATNDGEPRWMYENVDNPNRLWKFELDPETAKSDTLMYYISNVATGSYFGDGTSALVADKDGAISYAITQLQGTVVALDGNGETSKRIHANGHGGGSGKGNNIVYWASGLGTASAWRIAESEAYLADLDFTQIEEGADEYVAPAVKGIFDLFGRRIEAPAATGIYIVDGKKRVIKK